MISQLLSGSMGKYAIVSILLTIPAVLMSLTIHEVCHGLAAYRCGDPTAKNFGRLTLNPIKHLDPFGTICMLLFGFGWAKPVPIQPRNFRHFRRGMVITAAAGPLSNFCIGIICTIFCCITELIYIKARATGAADVLVILYSFFEISSFLNFAFFVFNMIPLPPFDGSRIFFVFLPPKYYMAVMKYERVIMIVFLLLLNLRIVNLPIQTAAQFFFNLFSALFFRIASLF